MAEMSSRASARLVLDAGVTALPPPPPLALSQAPLRFHWFVFMVPPVLVSQLLVLLTFSRLPTKGF